MQSDNSIRQCPYCKEQIKGDANKCKHCGSMLPAQDPSHGGICPYCKEGILDDAIKCKHCKSLLTFQGEIGCDDSRRLPAFSYPSVSSADLFPLYPGEIFDQGAAFESRFPSTLPKCRWVRRICGSSLPGYPPIYCYDYVCNYGGNDIVVISRLMA
jgi:hypothetical protein